MVAVGDIWQSVTEFVQQAAGAIGAAVGLGYDTAPALIFGLAVIVALPALMIGGMLLRRVAPDEVPRTSKVGQTQIVAMKSGSARSEGSSKGSPAFAAATLIVQSDGEAAGSAKVYKFGDGQMVMRIGREADNDLRLEHPTVHRYHAMVQRDFEEGYLISDLANPGGNGVFVNGSRVSHGKLSDGDEISLGEARLKFEIVG